MYEYDCIVVLLCMEEGVYDALYCFVCSACNYHFISNESAYIIIIIIACPLCLLLLQFMRLLLLLLLLFKNVLVLHISQPYAMFII